MADISKIVTPDGSEYNIKASTVNGHTVDKDVPSNAKFTDTLFYFSISTPDGHSISSTSGAPLSIGRGIGLNVELDPDHSTPNDINLFTTSDAYSYTDRVSNITGYMLITIKPETSWMLSFTINLYGNYEAYSVAISGYNFGSNHWHAPNAQLLYSSNGATSRTVYFGYTGDWKLWVAVPASAYQGLSITNITNGCTKITDRAADIFDISRVSSLPGTTQKTVNAVNNSVINLIYPVGSIYMSVTNANPGTWLVGTTWVAWGSGRVPVGVNTSDSNFNTVEKTGGEKTHTLSTAEMPAHRHALHIAGGTTTRPSAGAIKEGSWSGGVTKYWNDGGYMENFGDGGAHNNLQPYITCYMWKRTA